ncbi:M16 family metallopeptidase [Clostridium ihumii]|uniref:M16 family metallopeptidase n=1 Tax=Clostridium ihumii TaxID=1470356 RepID=UPI000553649C|nr:pitrilysin family protein [Clostridium ihumii]
MKKFILDNGIKIIYKKNENNITSFNIAVNAGAIVEDSNEYGISHAVEHMVFKGTKNRTEIEINRECDNIFGFHNAMTNYPYVVYYGTCLNEDFEKGIDIYSDIVLNPNFDEKNFEEEISVICEELKEWKDDTSQYCEDKLFLNGFNNRRIKELIIGNENSIKNFTIKDLKDFYQKHYKSENMTISVVSSLDFDKVVSIIKKYFNIESNKNDEIDKKVSLYEENKSGVFVENKDGINSCKIQYVFPIHELNNREIALLRIFNSYFGEGTSSILYDEVRTKKGLVYDINARLKNELGIKLYTINLGTSHENIDTAIEIINKEIEKVKNISNVFDEEKINSIIKTCKLKRILGLEKSITMSFNIATYELMYGDCNILFEEFNIENVTEEEILNVVNKVLKNPSIQIIK